MWRNVGLGLLWGAAAGFLGALLARPLHRRGRVDEPERAAATRTDPEQ
ncbi:hypothetical protein [Streptomyces avidinii]